MSGSKKNLAVLIGLVAILCFAACTNSGKNGPASDDLGRVGVSASAQLSASGLEKVTGFGSNPGNLAMYKYVPAGVSGNAPLVLVLHGCQQTAENYARDTEWNTLADKYKFYVIYGEENTSNQMYGCFRFYEPAHQVREKGEALSLKQMVDYMKTNYSIDSKKVFVTGLSAGGAMALVMLASYPDVFSAGGVNAAVAYKCDNDGITVFNSCMKGNTIRTPDDLKSRAQSAYPGYTGAYPKLIAFQGTQDEYVNYKNLAEVMKQWTAITKTDQTADISNQFKTFPHKVYTKDNTPQGEIVFESHEITGMKHGITVDPGSETDQGGIAQAPYSVMGSTYYFAYDFNFYSSYYIAQFFNILDKAPVVEIVAPAQNASVSGVLQIQANLSSEKDPLTQVVLKIGGEIRDTKNLSGLSSSYNYNWDTDQEIYGGQISVEVITYTAKMSAKSLVNVNINKPERLTASADKPTGTYDGTSLSVVLNASRPSAIFYTTDGSEPSQASQSIPNGSSITLYAANETLTVVTLKFFAQETSGQTSLMGEKQYTINPLRYTDTKNGSVIDHLSAGRITAANFMTYYNKYSYNNKFDLYLLKDSVLYTPKSGTRWADKQVDADAWK